MGGEIHFDVAEGETLLGERQPYAAQHGTDAGDELVGGKRFRDLVVGACFEAADPVRFLGARGRDDDRDVARGGPGPAVAPDRRHVAYRDQGDRPVRCGVRKGGDAGGQFEIGARDPEVDFLWIARGDDSFRGSENARVADRGDQIVARPAWPVTPEVAAMLAIPAGASKPPVWLASGGP